MDEALDIGCSIAIVVSLTIALVGHAAASAAAGRLLASQRVEREQGLPLLGRAPMHAVHRALTPVARGLVAARVSANAVTWTSLLLAIVAAIALAQGRLGLGALLACAAALADAVDGLVARESGTVSRLGQVLDTTIDRYVDALLLGGLAIHVRRDAALLVIVLAAIVGSFMVSYASAIERQLEVSGGPAPMRRAHRLAYVLAGAALGPFVARLAGPSRPDAGLLPILAAALAIALVGNVSAVRRLLAAGQRADTGARQAPDSSPRSEPDPDPDPDTPEALEGGARR